MKTLSLALITYSNVDINKYGLYRYTDTNKIKVLLFAYSVNDQEDIRIVDIANKEYIPAKIVRMLDDPNVIKYTFGFEYERVCLSKYMRRRTEFPIDSWRSTAELAQNFGMPGSLEELCRLFKLEQMECSYIESCKELFCKPENMSVEGRRIEPQEYPVSWKRLKEYCLWMIKTERNVRKKLYQCSISEMWLLREKLKRKYSSKGLLISEEKLKKNKQIFLQKMFQLKQQYEDIYTCLCNNNGELYQDFLRIIPKIEMCMQFDYRYIEARRCRNKKYYEADNVLYEMNMPLMLSKVGIPENDKQFCLIDFSDVLYEVFQLFADVGIYGHEYEKVKRTVKFVVQVHHPFQVGLLKMFWEAGALRIHLPTDNILSYINPQVKNGNIMFSYDGYNKAGNWETIDYSVNNLISNIAETILSDIIFVVAMQMDFHNIRIVTLSKKYILLEINSVEMVLVNAILDQLSVCNLNFIGKVKITYPVEEGTV